MRARQDTGQVNMVPRVYIIYNAMNLNVHEFSIDSNFTVIWHSYLSLAEASSLSCIRKADSPSNYGVKRQSSSFLDECASLVHWQRYFGRCIMALLNYWFENTQIFIVNLRQGIVSAETTLKSYAKINSAAFA